MPKIQPAAPNDPPTAPSTPMEFRESFLDPDGVDMATRALKNPLADLGALFERTETHIDLRRGQKSRQSANSSSAVGPLFRRKRDCSRLQKPGWRTTAPSAIQTASPRFLPPCRRRCAKGAVRCFNLGRRGGRCTPPRSPPPAAAWKRPTHVSEGAPPRNCTARMNNLREALQVRLAKGQLSADTLGVITAALDRATAEIERS